MSLFVMTGATSGFGLHAARLLLQNPNHELIVGVREAERASDLKCLTGQDRLTITPLDTSSLASVRNFAGFVRNQCSGRKITALGLNAGMQPSGV
jgi:NAD(P)-dependent dehydrogenase (short-subunit alcohol dehydrogenase family)